MATITNKRNQTIVTLRVNHTFGRDTATNLTALQSPAASRNHATIIWDGQKWCIKDSSSNGTYINNKRILASAYHPLNIGAKIQFGNTPAETWEIIDLSPPITALIPLTNNLELIPLHDAHILPIEKENIMVFLSEDGHWVCEVNDETYKLQPGDKVGADDKLWQFVEARVCESTTTMHSLQTNNTHFKFNSSRNEEHVSLKLIIDNTTIELGERNHHYLLLLLAKQRLADIEKGYSEAEQGWIKKDVLVRMMGIAEQHINIQIHRFRKQVTSEMLQSSTLHQIIERRAGELRFSHTNISIEGGFQNQKKKENYISSAC